MDKINTALQAGYAAYEKGAFADARQLLRHIKHPKAIHLLGLIEKSDGNLKLAVTLLQTAANLDPRDAEIASNLALVAIDDGNFELAITEFRRAIRMRPNFLPAVTGLGRLLIDLERYEEALEVYRAHSKDSPVDIGIRHGLATALLGVGQVAEAESIFDALIHEGNDEPQIRFMRGRARFELGQLESAIEDLKFSHAANPSTLTLKALANTYWMMQDNPSFTELLRQAMPIPELAVSSAEILRQSGAPETALLVLNNNGAVNYQQPDAWWIAATSHIDLKQAEKAETISRRRLTADPDDQPIKRSLIISLLMQGRAEEAMPLIEAMRQAEPNDQLWIAYETSALRLLGSERYDHIVDLDRFVRSYELQAPDGFDDIVSFNAAFLGALDKWHQFKAHPLDQSLRDGSQTPRDLTSIDDPVITAFFRALDTPIRAYMADVGAGDDHPLTARNTGQYKIAGSWSVKLHGGGRHVNHVHPEGWISSSYYVSVPKETKTDPHKAGWIKFAEPPFETSPQSPPQKWICPEAGILVLFPSFLWHGTQPIHDNSVRVTAPFDVVPA
jgi:tetratricopeptide (TPR) repeat protein